MRSSVFVMSAPLPALRTCDGSARSAPSAPRSRAPCSRGARPPDRRARAPPARTARSCTGRRSRARPASRICGTFSSRSASSTSTRCGSSIVVDGDVGIDDARDVDDAGPLREELGLAGEVVVEGVVHQPVDVRAAGLVDGVRPPAAWCAATRSGSRAARRGRSARARAGSAPSPSAPRRGRRATTGVPSLSGHITSAFAPAACGVVGERHGAGGQVARPDVERIERVDRDDRRRRPSRPPPSPSSGGTVPTTSGRSLRISTSVMPSVRAPGRRSPRPESFGVGDVVQGEAHGPDLRRRAPDAPAARSGRWFPGASCAATQASEEMAAT